MSHTYTCNVCHFSSDQWKDMLAHVCRKKPVKPVYYVSTCPDTGRQFLCQLGKDGNIAEMTPATVDGMRRQRIRVRGREQ